MSMERINLKKCALCDRETDLQLSHIIPKFVGRHLKKTSIGNIRNLEDHNNIIQDIEKHYMYVMTVRNYLVRVRDGLQIMYFIHGKKIRKMKYNIISICIIL